MFFKKQAFPTVDKFFNGNQKVIKCEGPWYIIENGDMELRVFLWGFARPSCEFFLKGGTIPLNKKEENYFGEKSVEYIRSLV